ncbi:MAG TPA: hypothetical protein VG649_25030 [Candidatus Angelobacter sp.]|jgi:hypothetical protein|nr:hypothetical protein [Candidatus Angelobacter sp.]
MHTSNEQWKNGLGRIVAHDPDVPLRWGFGVCSDVFPGFHAFHPGLIFLTRLRR